MDENFDIVELECYRVAILTELATCFAEPARVDFQQHARFLAESIMVRVEQDVWGEEAGVLRIETPATWWEMLKRDHAPRGSCAAGRCATRCRSIRRGRCTRK